MTIAGMDHLHGSILPQELVDIIIDYLRADPVALGICGLVCRAWVSSSRFHLFAVWDVYIQARDIGFSQFLELLNNPLCTFTSFVKCLSIEGQIRSYPNPWSSWVASTLRDLVFRFPFLNTLRLSFLDIQHDPWKPLIALRPFTSRITTLHLDRNVFYSIRNIYETIQSFENLVTLEWRSDYELSPEEVTRLESSIKLNDYGNPPSSLRVVDVHLSYTTPVQFMWRWLLDCEANQVNTLKIGHLQEDDVDALAQYMSFLGPSLEILQIDLKTQHEMFYLCDRIDLRRNTNLREIEIGSLWDIQYLLSYTLSERTLDVMHKVLNRLPPTIESIIFPIWSNKNSTAATSKQLHEQHVRAIDSLLSSRFTNLQVITFFAQNDLDPSIMVLLKALFPECNAQGMIYFKPREDPEA